MAGGREREAFQRRRFKQFADRIPMTPMSARGEAWQSTAAAAMSRHFHEPRASRSPTRETRLEQLFTNSVVRPTRRKDEQRPFFKRATQRRRRHTTAAAMKICTRIMLCRACRISSRERIAEFVGQLPRMTRRILAGGKDWPSSMRNHNVLRASRRVPPRRQTTIPSVTHRA